MRRLRGLYAITPEHRSPSLPLSAQVDQAIQGGARVIQYRDKRGDGDRRLREAGELLALCRRAGVLLIINDDLETAARIGADGVHLGRDDARPALARKRLGANAIIGASCYDSLERALHARDAGVDYVAFGRFFPSSTKPDAVQADPELLRQARRGLNLPVVAIGGITAQNGGLLIARGADMLAVVDGIFGQPDVTEAARNFSRLFFSQEVAAP